VLEYQYYISTASGNHYWLCNKCLLDTIGEREFAIALRESWTFSVGSKVARLINTYNYGWR
jgi:hypothetical protein